MATSSLNVEPPPGATRPRRARARNVLAAAVFLGPAMLVAGALLLYPIVFTFVRSTFDATGDRFVGLDNYRTIFTEPRTLIALRNNVIWVLVVPAFVTALGLVFAVLSESLTWVRAFRMSLFLPLVVSGLAAGVTFRFIYAGDPNVGFVNAVTRAVVHAFEPPGPYSGARPSQPSVLSAHEGGFVVSSELRPGDAAKVGLVGVPPRRLPASAALAGGALPRPGAITGVVWLDFSPGGARGTIDAGERGLPGARVQLLSAGKVVARTRSAADGSFRFDGLGAGAYTVALAAANFRPPFGGIPLLGPLLITPAIIAGYIWIHTGFALIIIGAGLTGLDPELKEAARIEGASEWQVFRHITVPLLRPVLLVVFVTTTIAVLKIFDLVLVIAPDSVQYDANVLALEMWRASFGGGRDFGLGSALAALLFLLIIPAMAFNLRRFRLEEG